MPSPENNIYYFVLGNSGKLMSDDFRKSGERAKDFDSDQTLLDVVNSYDERFNLGLTDQDKRDLVEYLKSF